MDICLICGVELDPGGGIEVVHNEFACPDCYALFFAELKPEADQTEEWIPWQLDEDQP